MHFASFFLCVLFTSELCESVKILKFTDDRAEKTGARLVNPKPEVEGDFTLCLDFIVTLIKDFRLLSTVDRGDLEILIPNSLDNVQVQLKGIWYIAYTNLVEPYNWGTLCLAYDATNHIVTFAYKGEVIFSKTGSFFPWTAVC